MKLEGTYQFKAPREVVWATLMDTDTLQRVLPGCTKLTQVGDNEYETLLNLQVGPVQGQFKGQVTISDIEEPSSYHLSVQGKGAPGHVEGEGDIRLEEKDEQTILHYQGEAQIGGKLASVGQRLMESSTKSLTQQSLKELDKQIQARLQPPPEAEAPESSTAAPATPPPRPRVPPPSGKPPAAPSQTEFALGVARNMVDDLIPPEKRPMLVATVAGGVGLAVFLWWVSKRVGSPSMQELRQQLAELDEHQIRPRLKELRQQLAELDERQLKPLVREWREQLTSLDEQQLRPFVRELREQLTQLDERQIKPFIREAQYQLAQLDEQQIRPFIVELSDQLSDLGEHRLRPFINELSQQFPEFPRPKRQPELPCKPSAKQGGFMAGGLMVVLVAVAWWFLNRRSSTD